MSHHKTTTLRFKFTIGEKTKITKNKLLFVIKIKKKKEKKTQNIKFVKKTQKKKKKNYV